MDFLKSAVASAVARGPLAAYSVQEKIPSEGLIWTLNNATKRENNTKCTIFTFDVYANKSRLPIAKNAVRKARTLHHPGVVKVIETIETDSHIYICTERVTALSQHVRARSLQEETIKWGLSNVAKTIRFINEEAASVHGCLRSTSIFLSDTGEWKVGGFELLSSTKEHDGVIYLYGSLVPDSGRFCPPEVAKGGWDVIRNQPVSSVDSYGFGVLLYEMFNGSFPGSEQALQVKELPPSMQQAYKRLMNPNPKTRISVAQFFDQGRRNGGFFQTPLINLSESLESLGLKSEGERDEFLAELNEVADDYPEDYMKRKVMPELLKSVEYGGGGAKVFSVVLKIGSKLSAEEYESQLTPVLVRLFASPDRAIRVCLLENLPLMIDHISNKIVNDKVFPNLVTGFTDAAPLVREQTVKSVLIIIPKLSERIINGELLKYLAKTANDSEPGIRTNTVICLGKIARNLSLGSRSKVLVAAFTRSLKDPFVHARNAALLALAATGDLFTDEDVAGKVLPAICPSLLDKEKMVRDQANKTLNMYLSRIRKAAEALPDSEAPGLEGLSKHGQANGSSSRSSAASPEPAATSSWTGWAMSSFASRVSGPATDLRPETPKASGTIQPKVAPTGAFSQPGRRDTPQQSVSSAASARSSDILDDSAAAAWGEADDAWGQEDADGDAFGEESSRDEAATTIAANGEEPDFAAWLAAKSATKQTTKTGLPKGLAPKAGARTSIGSTIRPVAGRAATTGSTQAPKKIVVQPKPQPKTEESKEVEEDDWGSAWD